MRSLLAPLLVLKVSVGIQSVVDASSAAGHETLVGVAGRDFVILGADTSASSSIAVTSSNVDKISVVVDPFPFLPKDKGEGEGGDAHLSGAVASESLPVYSVKSFDDPRKQRAVAVAAAGDSADADRIVSVLAAHAAVREYEAGVGCDVECVYDGRFQTGQDLGIDEGRPSVSVAAGLDAASIAHLARGEIASSLRSGGGHLRVCLLVAGMVWCDGAVEGRGRDVNDDEVSGRIRRQVEAAAEGMARSRTGGEVDVGDKPEPTAEGPEPGRLDRPAFVPSSEVRPPLSPRSGRQTLAPFLYWLDEYGSLQSVRYGAHGYGANFALSVLDRGYRPDLTREEAAALVRDCFDQLRARYVINSPQPPCLKCVDAEGCQLVR